jgi:sphinganine-1-phosphate aldolase
MIRLLANALLAKKDRFDAFIAGVVSLTCIEVGRRLLGSFSKLQELREDVGSVLLRLARVFPSVRAKVESEKQKAHVSFREALIPASLSVNHSLPDEGISEESLLAKLDAFSREEESHWTRGNLTGAVYSTDESFKAIQAFALGAFNKSNLLHPDLFTATRQMEAELIRMTLDLFSGGPETCGSVTSGGTESILLAVKSYRDQYRKRSPNIVIPSTAHAAFSKAGDYFGVEVRKARCDPRLAYEVDLGDMESLIDRNTIAVVGSAPGYPHGSIDPIPAIGKMARSRGIGCHVDACLGSYLLPFLKDELPYNVDFEVEGVTSISCDIHKYAYAPKGSSVLMWKTRELRKYQYSVCTDWEGGVYATPTISGSRSSACSVAAWATVMHIGKAGYAECAARIKSGAQLIAKTVEKDLSYELCLMGRVDTSVVSFTSNNGLNIYDIADYMKTKTKRKWALAMLQRPAGVHFAVTMANVDACAEFSEDLISAVHEERIRIEEGGSAGNSESAAVYGSTASIPKSLVKELVVDYLDVCYETG